MFQLVVGCPFTWDCHGCHILIKIYIFGSFVDFLITQLGRKYARSQTFLLCFKRPQVVFSFLFSRNWWHWNFVVIRVQLKIRSLLGNVFISPQTNTCNQLLYLAYLNSLASCNFLHLLVHASHAQFLSNRKNKIILSCARCNFFYWWVRLA